MASVDVATEETDDFEVELGPDVTRTAVETPEAEPITEVAKPAIEAPKAEEPDAESLELGLLERNTDGTFRKKDPVKRIKELTAKWRGTERELNALRAELTAAKPPTPAQAETTAEKFPTFTEWSEKNPTLDWDDYSEARTRAAIRAELAAERASTAERVQQSTASSQVERVIAAGRAAHADFDAVMTAAEEAGISFAANPALMDAILSDQDFGPELAYHLAAHPDEARRLASLSPFAAARESQVLLSRFAAAHSGPAATPVPETSKAKPPIKPVVGGPVVTDEPPDPDDVDLDKHVAYYDRKEREARRR